ncbi:MAG: tRNA lysidine(34) synthetase TilS [Saprospiraceae bacterium]|nr:tRNA lysidine(34) synthetase TilS [Saprospiraceae bacterium]
MNVLDRLNTKDLWSPEDKLLLAISGGLDSMVLLDMLHRQGQPLEVAHCNYVLREEASDLDQALVADICEQRGIVCHIKRVAPGDLIGSVQTEARAIRYEWMEMVRQRRECAVIATAHHLNDQVETILYRLTRGSGLSGLLGMQRRRGKIVRPLLEVPKKDLVAYAERHQVAFREDVSNLTTRYNRNFIRHRIVPAFEERTPDFIHRMDRNQAHWSRAHHVLQQYLERALAERLANEDRDAVLTIKKDDDAPLVEMLLFEWLKPMGFSEKQILNISSHLLFGSASKMFLAGEHIAVVHKFHVRVSQKKTAAVVDTKVQEGQSLVEVGNQTFHFSIESPGEDICPETSAPHVAYLDLSTVQYPLCIRTRRPGDYFYPLGLDGRKKLKKYLRESGMDAIQRARQLLLTSQEDICWVVGMRIDDRFKLHSNTTAVLRIECISQ